MSGSSAQLSIRPDCPVDPVSLAILRGINAACTLADVPYLIAGAAARDLILFHVYGRRIRRATRDIDFAVAVSSWQEFERLKNELIARTSFSAGDAHHTALYRATPGADPVGIDIIPFGGVEDQEGRIHWPPAGKTVMNVNGFDAAAANVFQVKLAEGEVIPVPSLPGLALLKLFAWLDRGRTTSKDALDLGTILREYAGAGQEDRLFEDRREILAAAGYDLTMAGAILLAEDVKQVAPPGVLRQLRGELETGNALRLMTVQVSLGQVQTGRDVNEVEEVMLLRRFWSRLFGAGPGEVR